MKQLEKENIIGMKWIYIPKFNRDKVFVENKSIIIKNYSQIQRIDFKKTYNVTAHLESFYLLLAIIASLNLYLWQLDFVDTYLNSNIDFDMYIKQPQKFVKKRSDIVWKLCKTLYRTIQGRHDWFKTLSTTYKKLEYK